MLYFLFFCSGASGLIYQVVWVRVFGMSFGNTIHSASLVIAVFMLGLGVGSYFVGEWADRRYAVEPQSLLRVFGSFELTIGLLALGVSMLLPHLGEVSAALSWYSQGPDAWYTLSSSSYFARAALAVALLAPITLLMGGTLTLLIRHVVQRDLHAGGWRIALLYGVNTAGAAAGCLVTDFALVPAYGTARTQLIAFALNMVAGLGAFALAKIAVVRLKPDATKENSDPTNDKRRRHADVRSVRLQPDPEHMADSSSVPWTAAAIALSGFAAMGLEIVWFRHFSMLLGEYRAVFSLLLAVILCGIGLGSLAGGWLSRRAGRPAQPWMVAQGLFVVSTLVGLTLVDARQIRDAATAAAASQPGATAWARAAAELWFNAQPILLVIALPALLMGVAFPLANALVQRAERPVGRRAGVLYLSNTAGAVAGSLAAGFLLLPTIGMQRSVTVLAAAAAAAIVPLQIAAPAGRRPARGSHGATPRRGVEVAAPGALLMAAAALGTWLLLPSDYLLSKGLLFPTEKAYAVSEGLTEVVAVTDGPNGGRVLVTNGHPMSSTELFSQRYMRAMAHIPLLSHDNPRRVLVLCYGVGNTAHAVALHPSVERIEVVDLSRHVLEHSGYFEEFNRGVLRDPRVVVYVNDGRHHLRMQAPASYDLITLEPPPIVHAGVAALYSREFYATARFRLGPKGMISQWLPVFGVPHEIVLSMVRAFLEVFPNAVLLSGANMNLLLVGTNDTRTGIDPARVRNALARAPAVDADLRRLDLGTLREIVGTFVADAGTLADATQDAAPVTDDRPLQEYGKRSLVDFGEGGIPPSLVAVSRVAAWCPGCFSGGRPVAAVDGLDAYLSLVELAYRTLPGRTPAGSTAAGRTVAGSGYLGSIVPESPELSALVAALESRSAGRVRPPSPEASADPANERYRRATELLESGRFGEAVDEFRAVLRLVPGAVEARNNLGVALASLGRLEEAIDQFQQALALRPDFADAQRNLALALERRKAR
ncbi:MAG: tetratricopeptide repeat protein [Acidobacteria bacterium]|nr:tetratricopeptide repeat protein [Acidobacteriota bacterium]